MKALNYSDFMWRQKKSYQEIFDENPELYIEPDEWDIQKERMPFGKYTGLFMTCSIMTMDIFST